MAFFRKQLPASIGTYRLILSSELTAAQRARLRAESCERIVDGLTRLIATGAIPASVERT